MTNTNPYGILEGLLRIKNNMFTGIISNLGNLEEKNDLLFTFSAPKSFLKDISKGTSVSVNGVCLTVFKKEKNNFSVEIMPETEKRTMLGNLRVNDSVNLELPAKPDDFLSGHIVQGHVDGVGEVAGIKKNKNSHLITIIIPGNLVKYIVEKGPIAVNGISLTVIKVKKESFMVGIIPFTWENTMFKKIKVEDTVNIEVDIIAKYVEKLIKNKL